MENFFAHLFSLVAFYSFSSFEFQLVAMLIYNLKVYKINLQSQSLSDIRFIDNFFKKEKNLLIKEVKLPLKTKRFVVVKSPHVNKKSKEHFQIKTYKRLYYLKEDYFAVKEMIQHIPSGISVKVTKTTSSGNSAVR